MRRPLAIAAAIIVAACSSEEGATDIESTAFASSLGVNLAASTKTANGVYYRDIQVGAGATVANGQTLGMRYAGYLANGAQFDANQAPSAPFTFQLGASQVIDGWDEGIPGMKVGGRRQLVIPWQLAYGAAGYGPIPPNANLVFNVEVVSAQ